MIFDGRQFATKIELELKEKISLLSVKPKLVVILDPNNSASVTYTNLKEKFANRIGVVFERGDLAKLSEYNADPSVNGIIIQLPYPESDKYINMVDPTKDVDGLRPDSKYMTAVVRAVRTTLGLTATPSYIGGGQGVVIVGSQGFVGRKLMKEFPDAIGIDKDDFDPSLLNGADIIISATGQPGLIKSEMVKDGVVAIDLGYPTGDFDPLVADKASLFTPVPGGVGPVTVAMLFQNLLDSIHA
jgi:methylenetetrahydrofolate dehydrogenase (NADP+)/methenyltetrahydrofolate cyclohydrolase